MTGLLSHIDLWDLLLAALLAATLAFGALSTPSFLTAFNLSQLAAGAAEKALVVLPMVLLIIAREIDLSVASALALASVVLGLLVQANVPLVVAVALTILAGGALGAFNGLIVTALGLPSLVVTLGTMALFRGVGYILLGAGSINVFPDELTSFGVDELPGTHIPYVVLPFLVLAPIFAVVLQSTPTGKRIYAIGGNPSAALYSGIGVARVRFWLFVVSGLMAALAGVVYTARLNNARANNALGMELDVITIALLGGVSVWGGKGKLTGVVLALLLIAALRNLLGLNQVGGDAQGTAIGLLLIVSLLIGNAAEFLAVVLKSNEAKAKMSG